MSRCIAAASAVVFSLSVCAPSIAAPQAKLHAAVVARLKDSESAKFRGEFTSKSEDPTSGITSLCGEINSRNGFGGYSGFHRFISNTNGIIVFEETEPQGFDAVWATWCAHP